MVVLVSPLVRYIAFTDHWKLRKTSKNTVQPEAKLNKMRNVTQQPGPYVNWAQVVVKILGLFVFGCLVLALVRTGLLAAPVVLLNLSF